MAKLTDQQSSAVGYYCNPASETFNNWMQSLINAKYSPKYADHRGWELLGKEHIKQAIKAKRGVLAKKSDVTTDEIIAELRAIAFDKKANKGDKLRALEFLGKYRGMFTDKGAGQDVKIYLDMSEKGA